MFAYAWTHVTSQTIIQKDLQQILRWLSKARSKFSSTPWKFRKQTFENAEFAEFPSPFYIHHVSFYLFIILPDENQPQRFPQKQTLTNLIFDEYS